MQTSSYVIALLAVFWAGIAFADDPNSVSDYYRATGRDPSFQQRVDDFNKLRPSERYTGSAEQNTFLNKSLRFGDQLAAQGEPTMGLFRSPEQSKQRENTSLNSRNANNVGHRTSPPQWRSPPQPSETEEGVQPDWLDPIGMIAGGLFSRVGSAARSGFGARPVPRTVPQRIDSGRLLHRSAMDRSPHHNFPVQLDDWVFEGAKQVKGPQYHLYTRPGTLNGKPGTYEIGVKPSPTGNNEAVMHRLFRPGEK